jgi:hypothetical protein
MKQRSARTDSHLDSLEPDEHPVLKLMEGAVESSCAQLVQAPAHLHRKHIRVYFRLNSGTVIVAF